MSMTNLSCVGQTLQIAHLTYSSYRHFICWICKGIWSQQMGDADLCYDLVYSNCRHLVEAKRLSINAYAVHFSYTHSLLNKRAQYLFVNGNLFMPIIYHLCHLHYDVYHGVCLHALYALNL
jgi:hypothetical protein